MRRSIRPTSHPTDRNAEESTYFKSLSISPPTKAKQRTPKPLIRWSSLPLPPHSSTIISLPLPLRHSRLFPISASSATPSVVLFRAALLRRWERLRSTVRIGVSVTVRLTVTARAGGLALAVLVEVGSGVLRNLFAGFDDAAYNYCSGLLVTGSTSCL